jgi:DNA-binding transcriptional regulator YdaS (Cro superfamily)
MAATTEPLEQMHPIRAYRMKHGRTLKSMAKTLGISVSILAMYELGQRRIPPLRAVKIEKKLKGALKRAALCPEVFGPDV